MKKGIEALTVATLGLGLASCSFDLDHEVKMEDVKPNPQAYMSLVVPDSMTAEEVVSDFEEAATLAKTKEYGLQVLVNCDIHKLEIDVNNKNRVQFNCTMKRDFTEEKPESGPLSMLDD
jgi:hypothetical protein